MYLTTLLLTFKSANIIGGDYAGQAALPQQIYPLKNGTVCGPFSPTQMESINNCLFFSNNDYLFYAAICVLFDLCDCEGKVYVCVCTQGLKPVICCIGGWEMYS